MTWELHCGDCLEILPTIRNVDCVVTDPPYGIGKHNIIPFSRTERNSKGRTCIGDGFVWDEGRKAAEVAAFARLAETAVVWGGNYYADVLPASRCWLVWDKMNSGNFSDFEMAWTSMDSAAKMFRYMWNGMLKQKPEERYHPTQKPLDLMRWCIRLASNPGDTILDPFAGSGTTGVAAILEGRNFIGIEIDAGYCAIARKRLEDASAQQPLFSHAELALQPQQAVLV